MAHQQNQGVTEIAVTLFLFGCTRVASFSHHFSVSPAFTAIFRGMKRLDDRFGIRARVLFDPERFDLAIGKRLFP
jgi:hypothetical protein